MCFFYYYKTIWMFLFVEGKKVRTALSCKSSNPTLDDNPVHIFIVKKNQFQRMIGLPNP